METGIRIDKWLWSVRFFKTRSLATDACRSGRITMGDKPVKPSREVRGGETVVIRQSAVWRTVRILGLPPNRVGAALVTGFMEDLTPAEELEKLKKVRPVHFEFREHGSGRPTKRDRRRIEHLKKMIDG